jgi:hypothetical protein
MHNKNTCQHAFTSTRTASLFVVLLRVPVVRNIPYQNDENRGDALRPFMGALKCLTNSSKLWRLDLLAANAIKVVLFAPLTRKQLQR